MSPLNRSGVDLYPRASETANSHICLRQMPLARTHNMYFDMLIAFHQIIVQAVRRESGFSSIFIGEDVGLRPVRGLGGGYRCGIYVINLRNGQL